MSRVGRFLQFGSSTKWFALEDESGMPLASDAPLGADDPPEHRPAAKCVNVLVFSRREFADQVRGESGLRGLRVVEHSGRVQAAEFFDKIVKLGAKAMIVDSGQPHAHWFSIIAKNWSPLAVNRARAAQIGLVLP